MDQGVHTASLPEVVDGGQHRRRAPGSTGQRIGLGALLIGIAVATVAVPPLITPGRKQAAPPPTIASPAPIAELVPAVTASASPSAASPSAAPSPSARKGCAVQVTTTPACAIYTGSLGNGWSVRGDGLKVLPGELVPGTEDRAMRVERTRPAIPATALSLTARSALGITPGDRLKLWVWGGREFGTVLKLSVVPGGRGPLTLTAPADRWTSYSIKLADLTHGRTLTRIDLTVAADQVPNVNRFFLDGIGLA